MAPEGVEGVVELKGSVEKVLRELIEGVKAGLAHSGARNISDFQQKAGMWIQVWNFLGGWNVPLNTI